MNGEELSTIVDMVLSSIRTNSITIEGLTPVQDLNEGDCFEVSGGKRITYADLRSIIISYIRDQLQEYESLDIQFRDLKGQITNNVLPAIVDLHNFTDEAQRDIDDLQSDLADMNEDLALERSNRQEGDEALAESLASTDAMARGTAAVARSINLSDIDNAQLYVIGSVFRVMYTSTVSAGVLISANEDGAYDQHFITSLPIDNNGNLQVSAGIPHGTSHVYHRCYQNGSWGKWREIAGDQTLGRISEIVNRIDEMLHTVESLERDKATSAEVAEAKAAIVDLQSDLADLNEDLAQEKSNRQSADTALRQDIDTKVPKSMIEQSLSEGPDKIPSSAAVSYAVGEKLNASVVEQSISDSHSKVPTSKAVKTAVDSLDDTKADKTSLTSAINSEQTARESADTALQHDIDTLSGDLATEIANRQSAETGLGSSIANLDSTKASKAELSTAIGSEQSARQSADVTLQADINAEASAREREDAFLQSSINAERELRQSADDALQTSINAEATTRWREDATLDSRIDTEIERRVAGDSALDARITAEVTAREQSVAAEAALRSGKDAELETAIVDVSARVDLLTPIIVDDEESLRELEGQGSLVEGQIYCTLED